MPDYSAQVAPADRWAIAAYIRALQLSQDAKASDVPSGTQIQNLTDIAQQEGLPANYAGPWPVPATAVSAEPQTGVVAGGPAKVASTPNATVQGPKNSGTSSTSAQPPASK
jgi:hypothetical protein